MSNGFVLEKTVYLAETNAEGNVYFARFFDWQGETRESYLKQAVSSEEYAAMMSSGLRLVTTNASITYHAPLYLFDEVQIKLTTRNIRNATLEMMFRYMNKKTGKLVAEGLQRLAFQANNGHLVHIPEPIRRIALAIEETPDSAEVKSQAVH
jgi:enediyne core biosynthesis thioesterase